jgi:hypothetical protein
MALFPAPFVLLDLPNVQYVAYEIQRFAGVVFEKVVESVGLTVSSAKVYITNKNRAISF